MKTLTLLKQYRLGYLIVSLYFVANCVGFILGGAFNVWFNDRIGFGKIMVIATIIQLAAYTIQATGPPFPVMVAANFLTGLGLSLQNAQANGFVSSLTDNMETKLGMLHATYGLGAFTAPFVATYFSGQRRWSFHYLVSASMAVLNTLSLVLVFRFKHLDELLEEGGQAPAELNSSAPRQSNFRQLFGLRSVHVLTIFAIIYIGIEVTVGGWIVTFIIRERGGGYASGYISSGFFGGEVSLDLCPSLTYLVVCEALCSDASGSCGSISWSGNMRSYIAIVLEITIWFVPSIIGNAVAVSLIGLAMGPMFPVMLSHASKVLPRWLLTVCIGWISGIGMVGSAALPFLTGLLSSRFGIVSLQPLMVSMMSAMLVRKKLEELKKMQPLDELPEVLIPHAIPSLIRIPPLLRRGYPLTRDVFARFIEKDGRFIEGVPVLGDDFHLSGLLSTPKALQQIVGWPVKCYHVYGIPEDEPDAVLFELANSYSVNHNAPPEVEEKLLPRIVERRVEEL
ncbi:putative major facilitator superfamily protein [Lyophyllum shimeji]|uniref:Major facilitator superfamily protein n=1 Tax=Lyophyllum shimeji TaxID=47721 RepID=A0A9P3UQJ6_LYOSH|nr:putative major facilitator superfamily protein [Lyophyllum shimeji]